MNDPFTLQRFIDAQAGIYDRVCEELSVGQKTSHWMWFIFPQIRGLGHTETSIFFAISSLSEARAYLQHPVLGQRLHECGDLVLHIEGRSASQIFGLPDDLKLKSSMTLFAHATEEDAVYKNVLDKYFNSRFDPRTLQLLGIE